MKPLALISVIILGMGMALAEPPGAGDQERRKSGKRPGGPMGGRGGFAEFLNRADKDGDGAVSREEFFALERLSRLTEEQRQRMFDRLDKDGDGMIRRDEFPEAQRGPGGRPGGPIPRMQELDTGGDGAVSFEEFQKSPVVQRMDEPRRRKFFDRLDTNGDGVISAKDRQPGRRGPGGPGGRRPQQGKGGPDFKTLDTNGDGVIDFEEFSNFPRHQDVSEDALEDRFEKADTNGDLKLSEEELKQARDKSPGKRPKGSQKRGPKGSKGPKGPKGPDSE